MQEEFHLQSNFGICLHSCSLDTTELVHKKVVLTLNKLPAKKEVTQVALKEIHSSFVICHLLASPKKTARTKEQMHSSTNL